MPRQNRVTPFGGIIATPERGTFMGNRGVLHLEDGNIAEGRLTSQHGDACVCVCQTRKCNAIHFRRLVLRSHAR